MPATRDARGRFVGRGGSARIRDTDRGYRALKERLRRMGQGKARVEVGVLGDAAAETHRGAQSVTLADVASWNEFGLGHVPERSFLRAWFDGATRENRATLKRAAEHVTARRMELARALELCGVKFQAEVQKRISQGVPPPNAPVTIERKGSAIPLIDKGQLVQGITFRVTG